MVVTQTIFERLGHFFRLIATSGNDSAQMCKYKIRAAYIGVYTY